MKNIFKNTFIIFNVFKMSKGYKYFARKIQGHFYQKCYDFNKEKYTGLRFYFLNFSSLYENSLH